DLWNSSNPFFRGAVKIDVSLYNGPGGSTLGNDGVLVCSESNNDHWRFMTIEAPYDDSHPRSRQSATGGFFKIAASYKLGRHELQTRASG
ncbi:MAG TPA: hypothetical protein VFM72_01455, partial [Aequorivita sp.]|nr:hypothetical protein [Aequorivita sp.]